LCAYAYDLAHLVRFLEQRSLGWNDFRPSTALELLAYLRRVPSRRPAQRLGLTVATEQGRLLSPATVQRVLAATSSFFEWAIAAEQYTAGANPMQRRVDHALGRVPDRYQPFVGAQSSAAGAAHGAGTAPDAPAPPDDRRGHRRVARPPHHTADLAIVLLMLDGGLRPGEVLCLQLDDISYGRR
jgi:integrase/recombinase XerD